MSRAVPLVVCLVCLPMSAAAQTTNAGFNEALSGSMASVVKNMHGTIRQNLSDAAASMPADEYSFKPSPQVRSFAELIGHVAIANYLFCSVARGEPMPVKDNFEKTVTDKAGAVKALGAALTYCDAAYKETTDANANTAVKLPAIGAPAGQSTRALYTAITELNHVRLTPGRRLELLERLRPAIEFVASGLRRHYLGQPVPLPEQAKKVAQLAHELFSQLATGYALVAQLMRSAEGRHALGAVLRAQQATPCSPVAVESILQREYPGGLAALATAWAGAMRDPAVDVRAY